MPRALSCNFSLIRSSINIASERPENFPGQRGISRKSRCCVASKSHVTAESFSFYHKQDRLENFLRPGTVFVSKYISIAFATLQFTALSARWKEGTERVDTRTTMMRR